MPKNALKLFNFATFLQTQILMLPVLSLFYFEHGLTLGDYFLFQGIFSISALLFEIPAGYVGDIFPRRSVLLFSFSLFLARLILWSLLYVGGAFTSFIGAYWIILIGEILYSMSKAFYSGVADGYVYDYLKSRNKTHKMLHGYGRLNFCMSLGTALAALVGPVLYEKFGFVTLIFIEMVLNSAAILFLYCLPKVPSCHKKIKGLKAKYVELFKITKTSLTNPKIKYHMFYSGILAGTTMIFVWSFQPLMKIAGIPVALFGIIYCVNHAFRALSGLLLPKTMRFISLNNVGRLAFLMFIASFLSCMLIVYTKLPWLTFSLLVFICLAIGFQLTFTLGHVSRLHACIASDIRSTVSSVNTVISRFVAGFLLIMFKFLLDDISLSTSFVVYLGLFLISIYPLYKLLRVQDDVKVS